MVKVTVGGGHYRRRIAQGVPQNTAWVPDLNLSISYNSANGCTWIATSDSRLHIIGDAGHSMTEPPIAAKLVAIMNGLQ